jgi:hypothetical protein
MAVARSWKQADAAAATRDFLSVPQPRRSAIRDLMAELRSPEPFARRSAADLARRVSAREPGALRERAGELIALIAEFADEQWQARGWVTLAAALNAKTHAQRMCLADHVRTQCKERRIGVRAIALEAFAILAAAEPELRKEAVLMIEHARKNEAYAVRIRARRVLLPLLAPRIKINK